MEANRSKQKQQMLSQSPMFNERGEPLLPPPMPAHGMTYPSNRPFFRGWFTIRNFAIQRKEPGKPFWETVYISGWTKKEDELCFKFQKAASTEKGEHLALLAGGYFTGTSLYDDPIYTERQRKEQKKYDRARKKLERKSK